MAAPKKLRGKIGVIGLGIIGTRVATNLRSAGHQVYVWSRTPRAAPNFLGSVVEVADLCDVIQLFISDDGALHEVIRTIAAALRPRHVVLCHATVSPSATRQAAGIVESQGARYLDAPFTGSKTAAQNRQLVYYVGGAKPALEEVRPVLEATSKAILHVGGIGDASIVKIATNMLTASTVQTLAESLALVRAAGIDPAKLVEALENNGSRSGTSDLKLPAMIAANTDPNFSLRHMLKDVRFAQDLADKYELSLPVTDTTAEVLALGMQNEWGDQDFSVVAQLYPVPGSEQPAPESEKSAPVPEPIAAKSKTAAIGPKAASVAPTPELAAAKAKTPTATPITDTPKKPAMPSAALEPSRSIVPPTEASPGKLAEPSSDAVSSTPTPVATDTSATDPAAAPASSSVDAKMPPATDGKLLSPATEEQLAALLLPPRPGSIAKSGSSDTPAAAKAQEQPTPDGPANGATSAVKNGDLTKPKPKDEPSLPVERTPKRELRPANATAPNAQEAASREKKSTFKFLRDFFKSVPTKPN